MSVNAATCGDRHDSDDCDGEHPSYPQRCPPTIMSTSAAAASAVAAAVAVNVAAADPAAGAAAANAGCWLSPKSAQSALRGQFKHT